MSSNSEDTGKFERPKIDSLYTIPSQLSSLVTLDYAGVSDPGKVRQGNEDHFLIFRLKRTCETLLTNLPNGDLPELFEEQGYALWVADGMGGMAAGEIASSSVLRDGMFMLLHDVKWNLRITEEEAKEVMERMREYVCQVDLKLTEKARSNRNLAGMGTTLSVAYSVGQDLFIVHVGDSRIYLFRDGQLFQLTRDHTVAESLAESGHISREEISTHKMRHVLTNAVGGGSGQINVELQRLRLVDGDRLLLCSDGLTDLVSDQQIITVLTETEESKTTCDKLVELALENGGSDNVTVVVAKYRIPLLEDGQKESD